MRLRKPRAEPRRCSSRPLIASVGSVGGAGAVEVGQDVGGALVRVRPRVTTSLSAVGTPWLSGRRSGGASAVGLGAVGFSVGGDHALVDAPGRFDLDVLVDGEKGGQPVPLLSVSRSAPVCRVRRAP